MDQKPTHEINKGRFERRLSHNMAGLQISDDECWIWGSTCFHRGDKRIPFFVSLDAGTRKGKQVYARRWAWEESHGPLAEGTSVVNVCGEELCVKPDVKHNRPMAHGQWLPRNATKVSEAIDDLQNIPPARVVSSEEDL